MNEKDELRQHVHLLTQAVSTLMALQQAQLANPPSPFLSENAAVLSEPTAALLKDLNDLRQRFQESAHNVAQHVTAQPEAVSPLHELKVERITIVEPDGTVRMVLSNQATAPDPVIEGQVFKGRSGGNNAGIIFYNEEGDECGGLVYSGKKTEEGYEAGAALLFDQFRQDQTVGLLYQDENGQRLAGLRVWERPNTSLLQGGRGAVRVFAGRDEDQAAVLHLCDGQGKVRIRLVVEAQGGARIEFLDAEGQVSKQFP